MSSGGSCRRRSHVILVMRSDLSGFSGHKAHVACACVAAASACFVLLRVPTPGVSLYCARHQLRPLPLPGRWTGAGVAGCVSARAGNITSLLLSLKPVGPMWNAVAGRARPEQLARVV